MNATLYRTLVASLPAPPPGQSLQDMHPDIAREWASDLNAPLSPEHFRPQANKKVWWRCEQGHVWMTTPNIRVFQGTGCPHCPRDPVLAPADWNLLASNPSVAGEWHRTRNGDLRPEVTWPNSNKKVWWQCKRGHEWSATVSSRTSGTGCPYCYGRFPSADNNLAVMYPELVKEWDKEGNVGLDPAQFTPHVGRKVWWHCGQGHRWQATIYNRAKNKSGCPFCARQANRRHSIESIDALARTRGGRCLSDQFISSRLKLRFSCGEGHVWEARADAILYDNKWCPLCGRRR
jgi:glutaredoxin